MRANHKPYILGITGGIASGKTAAAEHLMTLGAKVIDADQISRGLTGPGGKALPDIRAAFGDMFFLENGQMNRRMMSDVVFADIQKRRVLEAILHPMIQKEMLRQIDEYTANGAKVIVLNVPLLVESAMDALCDGYWVMALHPKDQAIRIMNRDGLTMEQAEARIASQMPLEKKTKNADAVIWTNRPLLETQKELTHLYADLQKQLA